MTRSVLVATAKNEAPYLLEWVAHHLELGFDDIILYQNDSDDLTHETMTLLQEMGIVTYSDNRAAPGRHQIRAYLRASRLPAYKAADWAMALDLDEFLVIKTGDGRLADLVAAVPEADVIRVNWRIFGSAHHRQPSDDLVTDRFRLTGHGVDADRFQPYKTLFRPAPFLRPGVHRPPALEGVDESTLRVVNGSGLALPDFRELNFNCTDPAGARLAQINHYMVRDLASFMLKIARGSAHQSNRAIGRRYWTARNQNLIRDDSMAPWLPRLHARMESLNRKSGGQLMELRRRAICRHMAQFWTLMEDRKVQNIHDFCLTRPGDTPLAGAAPAESEPETASDPDACRNP